MNKGFSIIELLVVISVITIITAIVLVSYQTGQQQFALQRSAFKLSQDIRRAQEMAVSTQECNHSEACPGGGVPVGGYGVYFEKDVAYYIIYADTSGDERYTSANEEALETIYLEGGIKIKNVQPVDRMSVNFKPPDPTVMLKDSSGAEKPDLTVTISLINNPSKTITIAVNKGGRIDIY